MKNVLVGILMVVSLSTYAYAEERVPQLSTLNKSEQRLKEQAQHEKTMREMFDAVEQCENAVRDLGKKAEQPKKEVTAQAAKSLPITAAKAEFTATNKTDLIDLINNMSTPILIGLYVVCFMFGGIIFYGIGKSTGHEKAMNEIRISNSQNLWNEYIKNLCGGQTHGR